jgi:hypothetical protein
MSRFFAVPVLATMLALVGIRMMGAPSPKADEPMSIVVSLPQDEPAVPERPAPAVSAPAPQASAAPTPAPAPAPTIIIIEPPPQPQTPVKTEVVERAVEVPQQPTIIYAPTTIYAPVIQAPPPPPQDVVETPVLVVTNASAPLPHPRHVAPRPEKFFKDIPFLPPTPRGPRWNP